MRLRKECSETRYHRADIGHRLKLQYVGCQQGIQIAEMPGQITRRGFADIADA